MSTPHPQLSSLADPISLGRIQVLLVPIQLSGSPLSSQQFEYWSKLFKSNTSLRSDELRLSSSPGPSQRGHVPTGSRGIPPGYSGGSSRTRFLPSSNLGSISKGATGPGGLANHVHLSYPSHPPARHLAGLSLLRISLFPLIVIGIALDPISGDLGEVDGYRVDGTEETTLAHGQTNGSSSTDSTKECFEDALTSLFPPTSPFPLVKRLILVPPKSPSRRSPHPDNTPKARHAELNGHAHDRKGKGVDREVVHAPSDGESAWIVKMLGELVGDTIGELGDLVAALETPQGLKTLSATLLPSLTSTMPDDNPLTHSSSPIPEGEIPPRPSTTTPSVSHSQSIDGLSAASVGISLKRTLTPGGRPTSVAAPSLPPLQTNAVASSSRDATPTSTSSSANPFRRSSAIPAAFTRSSSAASIASSSTIAPSHSSGSKYTTVSLGGLAGGRLLKLLGDTYLLAGMYGDAIKCFDDGAERCRGVGDVLWEALAREGRAVAGIGEAWEGRDGSDRSQPFPTSPIPVEILTHLLSSLACLSRAPLPYPSTILSPSPQAVSGSMSFAAPSSSNPSVVGTGEGLLAYLHTGLSLRIAHFLLIIWASLGWGSIALSSLFSHSLPRSFPPLLTLEDSRDPPRRQRRHRFLTVLHQRSQLDRHTIFAHAESALRPYHHALTKAEQVNLHTEVIWLARWLDLPRKEAFITREIVKQLGVLIVESREESRRRGAAGFSRKSSLTINGDRTPQLGRPSGVRRRESAEGNESVMVLFERAIQIMGLELLVMASPNAPRKEIRHTGTDEPKEPRFGWPELQVEMIKEGIAVAESLPDQNGVVRLCMTALKELHTFLNPGSQGVLSKMLPGALGVMRRRGATVDLPWWLPGVTVLSIELTSLPPNRLPMEHSREEIVAEKGRDPFLYNPRLRAAQAGKTILVAKEQIDIYVTLRNPFAFNLEIKDLSLLTTDVDFAVTPLAISIAPQSIQSIRIAGIASSAGSLQVRGVTLRLPDGAACDILLPVIDEAERKRQDKRKSQAVSEHSKAKRQGIDARRPSPLEPTRESAVPDASKDKWLECKVVDEQPLVWIKKTNLTHGTIMLYDGETSSIRITLENTSSVPVDFIKLSFDDSSSRSANAAIAEGELSPQHAYELEWDMFNRPVMRWDEDGETLIPPGGRTTISVRCLGKVGCTDGTIRIDYGYVKRSQDGAVPSSFQTRQITFPVIFTVYHTLEPHTLDIVRFTPSSLPSIREIDLEVKDQVVGLFPMSNGHLSPVPPTPRTPGTPRVREMEEASLVESMKTEMDGDHCLFGLCVSNVYGVPFEVSLARKAADGQDDLMTTRLVPPGATERLVLPLPRLFLPSATTAQPIPSLSTRQYVVDKSKRSAAQIQEERELFWYREQLLGSVSATWVEPGSKRQGTMSLRDQVVTPTLLDVYRIDDVDVEIVVAPREGDKLISGEFADVSVKITNRLERPFQPFIRLEPLPTSSTDPSWAQPTVPRRPQSGAPSHGIKNIIFDGCLSQVLPVLEPGSTETHALSAIFLSTGVYSFRAAVDELMSRGTVRQGPPKIRFSPLCSVRVHLEAT